MHDHQHAITVGRYLLHRKIARGGMATIHIARLMGDVGFSRIVAAKRMHPELAEDSEFVAMFLDEARIASKVNHRNVVPVLDVVTMGSEVMLVQEYVHGAPLSLLLRNSCEARGHVPIPVAASIACQVLAGLHAAHETVDEMGVPLHVVHRDVSPQNVMVANDGTARLLDFGVAKASLAAHVTRKGTFKGKLGYSSPEQIRGQATRQSDIYSLSVVLWELLVGHRLHGQTHGEAQLVAEIMAGHIPSVTDALAEERSWIGAYRWSQLEALEPIIRKGLDVTARRRWTTATDMEEAIAAAVPIAPASDVAAWLKAVGKEFIEDRERMIAEEEASWRRRASSPRAQSSLEVPLSTATEPDGLSPLGPLRSLRGLRGLATVVLLTMIVVCGAGIAFLVRDLEHRPGPPPAITPAAATTPAPPPRVQTPHDVTIVKPIDKAIDKPVEKPVVATERPIERPPVRTIEPPKKAESKPISRVRVSRPAPARAAPKAAPPPPPRATPPPPKPAAASTPDCSTPFYFEGRKKIFKAGCL